MGDIGLKAIMTSIDKELEEFKQKYSHIFILNTKEDDLGYEQERHKKYIEILGEFENLQYHMTKVIQHQSDNTPESQLELIERMLVAVYNKLSLDEEWRKLQVVKLDELEKSIKKAVSLIDESKEVIAVRQMMKDKKNGVKGTMPPPNEKITANELKQLYLVEGKSCREIANQYGMAENSIRSRLKALGIWTKNLQKVNSRTEDI